MKNPLINLKLRKEERGISIVELLIALPIISIILVTLISALFILYTSALAESARSNLRTSGQTLLINLQDELLFTISYGETIDVLLTDPFEPSGGWVYDSSPETLIINEVALDSTRRDDTRNIIRQLINPCATSIPTANPVAINSIIYYVEDNPDSDYDYFKKRTVTPEYSLCAIDTVTGDPCEPLSSTCRGNAKVTTCPQASVGTGTCGDADSILSENVISLELTYFAEGNIETAFPSAADKIEIVLTMGDKVFGKVIETEVKHTIRKIN
ncbi:MAG: type II secretory pathway pseudopilin PulG [Candidatus Saccharimonadales bacterium]|jgi:type II secretory pathway pseudopilin PulG